MDQPIVEFSLTFTVPLPVGAAPHDVRDALIEAFKEYVDRGIPIAIWGTEDLTLTEVKATPAQGS